MEKTKFYTEVASVDESDYYVTETLKEAVDYCKKMKFAYYEATIKEMADEEREYVEAYGHGNRMKNYDIYGDAIDYDNWKKEQTVKYNAAYYYFFDEIKKDRDMATKYFKIDDDDFWKKWGKDEKQT